MEFFDDAHSWFRSRSRPVGIGHLIEGLNGYQSCASDSINAIDFEAQFKDQDLDFDVIRWRGRKDTDDHNLGIEVVWGDGTSFDWTISQNPENQRTTVDRLTISDSGGILFACERKPTRDIESRAMMYDVSVNGRKTESEISFYGLRPASIVDLDERIFNAVDMVSKFSKSVLWVSAFRHPPARFLRWKGAVAWTLQPNGSDAVLVLASSKAVRISVSSWFERNMGQELIIEESRKREVRARMRSTMSLGFDVDLVDCGVGVAGCLPVLTALAMMRHRKDVNQNILILEEPETHLHSNLQRALAEEVCEVAEGLDGAIIVETHSEFFLRAIQLQIARGKLSPENVVIYWVRQDGDDGVSTADKISVDVNGRLKGNWPPEAFQDDLEIAADVQDAQLAGAGE